MGDDIDARIAGSLVTDRWTLTLANAWRLRITYVDEFSGEA